MDLRDEFERIKRGHRAAMVQTAARVVLGSSVIRVFRAGTKGELHSVLAQIPVWELGDLASGPDYSQWFADQLNATARELKRLNPGNGRIFPGYKWGHAAKVLNLFIREVVLHTRYFPDHVVDRLSLWLYSPVDGIIIERLRGLGHRLPFTKIKEIDSAEKFFLVQNLLSDAAQQAGIPRVWFDDNWGDRQ